MTQAEYSQALYIELCGLAGDDWSNVGYAIEAYSNIRLARAERDADRDAELDAQLDAEMRHVRQTSEYQKYGAFGVYGRSR